jgi:hypothetical protein
MTPRKRLVELLNTFNATPERICNFATYGTFEFLTDERVARDEIIYSEPLWFLAVMCHPDDLDSLKEQLREVNRCKK